MLSIDAKEEVFPKVVPVAVLIVVLSGPEGPGGLKGPVLVLVLRGGCLGRLVLAMLGTLGIDALASVLALASICLVACSKWLLVRLCSFPFSVYSRNTSSKSSSLDCSALELDSV